MPRRSINYRRLVALEDERKLEQLDALSKQGRLQGVDILNITIPATQPEKLVMNFLTRLGIKYGFQYKTDDNFRTNYPEQNFKRDFLLPDFNIIIEVFGTYWHSLPQTQGDDLFKITLALLNGMTVYQHGVQQVPSGGEMGKYVIWWDYEIFRDLPGLFARDVPEVLLPGAPRGTRLPITFDIQAERRERESRQAGIAARRLRPRIIPPAEKSIRRLRKRIFNINRINPYYKSQLEEARARVPRAVTKELKKLRSPLLKRRPTETLINK